MLKCGAVHCLSGLISLQYGEARKEKRLLQFDAKAWYNDVLGIGPIQLFEYCRIEVISCWHTVPIATMLPVFISRTSNTNRYTARGTDATKLCILIYGP